MIYVDPGAPKKSKYLKRWSSLSMERSSWLEHWRELSDYLQPRRSRFLTTDRNRGTKRNQNIINNTPLRASRVLASGMSSGITSPARPWFRLSTQDPRLNEASGVRSWLHHVEEAMREVIARSNIYNALPMIYGDLGVFGTTCCIIEEDPDDVIRAYVLPIGSYCLSNSYRLTVDTIYREFSMTVGQLVDRFGLDNVSEAVKNAYEKGDYDGWHEVLHVIEPRRKNPGIEDDVPKGMPFRSIWMEKKSSEDKFLRESGYREWPGVAPRWDVTGEDVYGCSPGMEALGDTKALQLLEKRKAQAADKIVNPPMKGPSSLRSQRASLLPGDITYVDAIGPGTSFEPSQMVPPQAIAVLNESIQQHEQRINSAFYADLWLALSNDDRSIPATAREIVERHEEKMLQLGPTLERVQDELLDPMIQRIYKIMVRRGLVPEPPEEIKASNFRIEYISVMAKAQKLVGTTGIERFLSVVQGAAALKPDVLDNVDFDEAITEYAEMVGLDPEIIKDEETVKAEREAKRQQEQQRATMEQGMAMTQGAKNLAQAKMNPSDPNLLQGLMTSIGAAPTTPQGMPPGVSPLPTYPPGGGGASPLPADIGGGP